MTNEAKAYLLKWIVDGKESPERIAALAESYAILVGADVSEKLAEYQSTHCPECGDHFPSDEVIG